MRAVTISAFSTTPARSIVIDRDTQLTAVQMAAGGLLTTDPSLAYAQLKTPSADLNFETIIVYSGSTEFLQFTPSMGFSQGDVIFFSPSVSGAATTLYFEP